MNGLVGSILRWTSGASSAQNSEINLINIGKSWVEATSYHAGVGPSMLALAQTPFQTLLLLQTGRRP
jgi:hypothetical protein